MELSPASRHGAWESLQGGALSFPAEVEPGLLFRGEVWWAIYSFLTTEGHLEGDPKSYKNQMEYLYDEILKRLVNAGIFTADSEWRWFAPIAKGL